MFKIYDTGSVRAGGLTNQQLQKTARDAVPDLHTELVLKVTPLVIDGKLLHSFFQFELFSATTRYRTCTVYCFCLLKCLGSSRVPMIKLEFLYTDHKNTRSSLFHSAENKHMAPNLSVTHGFRFSMKADYTNA